MLPIPFISLLTASVTGQYFEPIIPGTFVTSATTNSNDESTTLETTGESNNSVNH